MLLDTHVLLWLLTDSARLGDGSRHAISTATVVHVSAGSLWELATKTALGKVAVPDGLPGLIDAAGLAELPVTGAHAWEVRRLSDALPGDPFDRLLVTQARLESLELVTADAAILAAQPSGVALRDARD